MHRQTRGRLTAYAALVVVVTCMFTALPSSALARTRSTAPTPGQSTEPSASPIDEKTQLEIRKLRQETGRLRTLQVGVPLVTGILALFGAVAGFYRWSDERRRDRRLRIEKSFDENLRRVVDFPTATRPSSSAVVLALANLDSLIHQSDGWLREAMIGRVTEAIATAVVHDLDFVSLPHATFELLCFDRWPPWRARLEQSSEERTTVLYRYRQALRTLHDRSPTYFEHIRVGETGSYQVDDYTEESDFRLFTVLTRGYCAHVDSLSDPEERDAAIDDYAEVLQNTTLTGQIFGGDGPVDIR